MKLIKLHAADDEREIWINPEFILAVHVESHKTLVSMSELFPLEVKETLSEVFRKILEHLDEMEFEAFGPEGLANA